MIPKIIHYCWLSNEEIPDNLQECIDSWHKHMPQYKIKRWSTQNFDINSVPLVKQAYAAKKWAFAADYIRLYALYTEGGIYLDSDVMLYGDLSTLFDADFVSAVEYHPTVNDKKTNLDLLDSKFNRVGNSKKVFGIGIQAAILVSCQGHPLLKKCMDFYLNYSLDDLLRERLTAPTVLAYNAESYGYTYQNMEQRLKESIHLYSTKIISNFDQKNKYSLAVHCCAGSWLKQTRYRRLTKKLNRYKIYRFVRDCIKKAL